ncbi:unnamed protein product [Penicillium nalgiovense]|nr:unnamed protein product [Penicillium nalgiovense]
MFTQTTTTRNPADSMVSTWRHDRSQWNTYHWMIELLGLHLIDFDAEVPIFSKKDKIPAIREWTVHLWILLHAAIPLAIHHAYTIYTGQNMHLIGAFALYSSAFKLNGIHEMHIMRRLGQVYGFLDGDKHPRDEIPDVGVGKVIRELISTSTLRMVMAIFLTYQPGRHRHHWNGSGFPWRSACTVSRWTSGSTGITTPPDETSQSLAFCVRRPRAGIHGYYGYSASCVYHVEDYRLPMGFYGWWICFQYIAFSEFIGHSGLRLHGGAPSTVNWLLEIFDAELVIEDHDLHHRYGWRKSHNYGKQTRLWDSIFGTCHERIESVKENVDYTNRVTMPLL